MIVVTGGAGFIGSVLTRRLNRAGLTDILVVDHLGSTDKWKNLVPLAFSDYMDKGEFIDRLEQGNFVNSIDTIFHLGACSSTTERDAGYLIDNNFRYSVRIGTWRESHRSTRLIYASSAATYGNGDQGYSDDEKLLGTLRPLNMYGYSKHLFDLYAQRRGWLTEIVGLKYFNVFGPNENHKGDMRSVINKAFPRMRDEGKISLFESHRPDCRHGEQRRDFVYVQDAVEMTLFFMEHRDKTGIYNIDKAEDRRQVQRRDAQVADVIQFVEDPLQIAAHEVAERGRRAPRLGVGRIVGRVAVTKTIGKNLIEDRVADPRRRLERRLLAGIVAKPRAGFAGIELQPLRRQPPRLAAGAHVEDVLGRTVRDDGHAEKLVSVDRAKPLQCLFALGRTTAPHNLRVVEGVARALQFQDDAAIPQRVDKPPRLRLMPHANIDRSGC